MSDVTRKKTRRFVPPRNKRAATDVRVDPVLLDTVTVEAPDNTGSLQEPEIRLGNTASDVGDGRIEPKFFPRLPEANTPPPALQDHALRVSRALARVFDQTGGGEGDTKAADDPHIKRLCTLFPAVDDNPDHHEVVLRNDSCALTVIPTKISYKPVAGQDGHAPDIKKSFTADSAYAMALIASKNKAMLEKGVRLSGSQEQQALLRAAIERVNEELPEGQKLRILPPKTVKPVQAVAATQTQAPKTLAPQAAPRSVVKGETPAPAVPPSRPPVSIAPPAQRPIFVDPTNVAREKHQAPPAGTSVKSSKMPWLTGAATGVLAALFLINSTDAVKAHSNIPQENDFMRGGSHTAFEPASQKNDVRLTSLTPLTSLAPPIRRGAQDVPPEPLTIASIDRRGTFGAVSSLPDRAFSAPMAGQLTIVRQNGASSMTLDLAHFNRLKRDDVALAQYRSEFNIVASDVRKGVVKEMDPYLLDTLTTVVGKLRDQGYDANQIVINSGYRTHDTNRRVGGADNSQHLHADAIDFSVTGVPIGVLYDTCAEVIGTRGGLGRYGTYIHLDSRPSFARWGRPAPSAS